MRRTGGPTSKQRLAIEAECDHAGPDSPSPVPSLRWKVGLETPLLVSSIPAAVELCRSILDGTAVELPSIAVSEAVAVQVYRLVVKDQALSSSSILDVYVILASLYHGRIVQRDVD
eukprot:4764486-Prymnesium_polylepis.1